MKLYMSHFNLYGETFEERFFDIKIMNTMETANILQVTVVSGLGEVLFKERIVLFISWERYLSRRRRLLEAF